MKKIFLLLLLLLALPTTAYGITYQWDRIGSGLYPLNQILDVIHGNTFQATSTSQASRFPYASTTVTSATSLCLGSDCRAVWPSGAGTVTDIATTYPVTGGPITTTGTIGLAFGTTTSNTWALAQTFTLSPIFSTLGAGTVNSTAGGTIYNTATSTPSVTAPITYSGVLGDLIGGSSGTFACTTATGSVTGCLSSTDWTRFNNKVSSTSLSAVYPIAYNSTTGVFTFGGLSTSTPFTGSGVAYRTSDSAIATAATTSVSCSGGTSCTSFTAIGDAPITISSSAASAPIATSTNETAGQLSYWTTTSDTPARLGQVSTTSLTASGVVSLSNPVSVIGASPSAITITGGTNGQVLGWLSGAPTWTASSSVAAGTGISVSASGAVTTVTNTGVTSFAGTANQILASASTGAVTGSLATHVIFPSSYQAAFGSTTNATSTTSHYLPYLATPAGTFLAVDAAGRIIATTTPSSGGSAFPFTTTTYGGQTVNASTTGILLTGSPLSLIASSTFATNATSTNATSTSLNVSGQVDFDQLTSALILTGSTGILAEYGGAAACTNQFVTAISAVGATTCASINNGQWSGTDLSVANGGTGLSTFGGTNTVLYTTTADNLSSEAAFTYVPTTDLLSFTYGSSTSISSSQGSWLATAGGRVGIGSTTPMSKLGVMGTTTTEVLNVDNPTHVGTSTMYIYSPTAAFGGEIILEDSDGAGCTSITALNGVVSGITVTCPANPLAN